MPTDAVGTAAISPALARRRRAVRAVVAVGLVTLAGCAAGGVDPARGAPATVAAAPDPGPPDQEVSPGTVTDATAGPDSDLLIDSWQPPADLPATGRVTAAPIPGTVSGFDAGDAWIYLPPAYATVPRPRLPVLVLMAGQPGEPRNWFDGGDVAGTMDAYAATHAGLAPVVVVPDWLGTSGGNPLCVDSPGTGNDWTYLTVDVHDWILDRLQVAPDPARWAVGGLSAGGTCALQLATRDPAAYPTVLAFSAQDHPVLETGDDTLDTMFGGDRAAYDAVDPMALLADGTYPASAGFFAAGADDAVYGPQTAAVYAAARDAGMDARYAILPGGHDFSFWSAALALTVPWLGARLGISA
ncbi:alpha/beta hydrolase [Nakamurella deserti]|uniref:alpha/beta hydrolase n=1 Tax=Nakamurella deserti TaxID=2164074 RepID=UPI000DBE3D62|nr:alpha/beta hydrolase-fold protein [Nakamurella deserti]